MSGSVLAVSGTGPEDVPFTSDPQMSLFTTGYMKHTHYAKESTELPISGQISFGKKLFVPLGRQGDLIGKIWTMWTFPGIRHRANPIKGGRKNHRRPQRYVSEYSQDSESESSQSEYSSESSSDANGYGGLPQQWAYWNNSIAHVVMEWVAFQIAGQDIDRHYGEWMELYDEFTCKAGKETDEMVGRYQDEYRLWLASRKTQIRYAKLRFFFCEYIGMALPILAIHFSNLRLVIKIRDLDDCWLSSDNSRPYLANANRELSPSDINVQVYGNIYYLTEAERKEINESSHEMVFTQNQYNGGQRIPRQSAKAGKTSIDVPVPFQHTVTEFMVTLQDEEHIKNKDWFNWSGKYGQDPIAELGLKINNSCRISRRPASFFRLCEADEHYSRIPKRHGYAMAQAYTPEDTGTPDGGLNCSRFDSVTIEVTPQKGLGAAICNVWGRSQNIFRATRGLAGTAWR